MHIISACAHSTHQETKLPGFASREEAKSIIVRTNRLMPKDLVSRMTQAPEDNANGMGMPVWLDDLHIDCEWLKKKCSKPIQAKTCTVKDISNKGRLGSTPRDGATLLLTLGDEQLVIKQIPQKRAALSKQLGLGREAFFYQSLAPTLSQVSSSLPQIYYAYANAETGEKCIVMEALPSPEWVDSGIFFGPGNPNNWARNLPAMIASAYDCVTDAPSAAAVATRTFQAIAHTHAAFWKKPSLLDPSNDWLRGQEWLQGKGKDSWEASQQLIRGMWTQYNADDGKNKNDALKWNQTVRAAVDKAVAGISWETQLHRLHVDGRWTLVHGDFWPGNVMWNSTNGSIKLLDWEMVGVGSGPQDLGQYVLSNMDPEERRSCERNLVQTYYKELLKFGVANEDVLWDYCWKEYTIGGVERWLWFLIYFVAQPNMADWAQFFHNQIAAFMEDHNLSADDITQPRP
jgi:hypothetical protein